MKKIPVFPIGYGWMVKMKLFEKYFVPYAEYTLRTTLSEEELKAAFEKEFPPVFSFAAFKAGFGTDKFSFTRGSKPFHLHSGTTGRNSFRGEISIRCEKANFSSDTILHLTIAPQNMSLFCWIYVSFAMLMGILLLCAGKWQAVVPLVMIAFMFLILHLCRSAAENEIPEISKAFERTLRTIEEKYTSCNIFQKIPVRKRACRIKHPNKYNRQY